MTEGDKEVYARARELAEKFSSQPAYMCDDEYWYLAVEEARAQLGIPEAAPVCRHCGSVAPYGDARLQWIDTHQSIFHRLYWNQIRSKVERFLCRRLGHRYPEDWCHDNPNDDPIWWASKTCTRCHERLWHRMVVW